MQIHELNDFSGALGSNAYLAIDGGRDTGKISTQQLLSSTEARIDNIIAGDAPSAAEVTDARYGANGVTYSSLGTAIRTQVSNLKADIDYNNGSKTLSFKQGYIVLTNVSAGQTVDLTPIVPDTNPENWGYAIVDCDPNDIFTISGTGASGGRLWAFVDSANKMIAAAEGGETLTNTEIIAPANASKAIFNTRTGGIVVAGRTIANNFISNNTNAKKINLDLYGGAVYVPAISNGSLPNPGNANAVHTSEVPVSPNDVAELLIDRQLDTNHVYYISYRIIRSGGRVPIDDALGENVFVLNPIPDNAVAIQFQINERNAPGGTVVPLRESNFVPGTVEILIRKNGVASFEKQINENKINATKSVSTQTDVAITPTIRNGSGPNPGNANAVYAMNIPVPADAYEIRFINNRPVSSEGNYYLYNIGIALNDTFKTDFISGIRDNKYTFRRSDISKLSTSSNWNYIGITIYERDANDDPVPLRITDFDNGDFVVQYSWRLPEELENNIVNRNKDIRPLIDASCYYGHNGNGSANINKQFALLITTDVHGDSARFESAIKYLNNIAPINAGICLGDMAEGNWTDPYQWYADAVLKSDKTWLTVIGNHDGGNSADASISATVDQTFARWIEPTLSKIGDSELEKTYYAYRNTTHKVEIIVLNVQDVPDTVNSGTGNFVVSRGALGVFSQEQVSWLVSELASIPSDYVLVVALHILPNVVSIDPGIWTNPGANNPVSDVTIYDGMIPEIINAWINGESLSKSYHETGGSYEDVLPTITVAANFSSRGTGKFAGYLAGHMHRDYVGHVVDYPNQKYYCFDATANDNWQNGGSDLPRTKDTKEEDCITVVAVDKSTDTIRLVRVGSNFTTEMTDRRFFKLSY